MRRRYHPLHAVVDERPVLHPHVRSQEFVERRGVFGIEPTDVFVVALALHAAILALTGAG